MESFSLLKYWRTTTTTAATTPTNNTPNTNTNTDSPSIPIPLPETEDDSSSSDEGPFFDLEFAIDDDDDDDDDEEEEEEDPDHVQDDGEVNEFKFSLPTDDHPLSPSSDLFFKGRLLPLEPTSEPNTKHHILPHHHPHLSLKSKLLVFALGLKKHHQQKPSTATSSSSDPNTSPATQGYRPHKHVGRFFAVKLEEVPIVSLFTKDNTNNPSSKDRSQAQRPSVDDEDLSRRFSKETLHKYLNKIKPLYVKVSKKHAVKTTVGGRGSDNHHSRPPKEAEVEASMVPSGKSVVRKHLGKSRSASSTVAAAPSPSPPPPAFARRRDDSLLQQQDGIQSAIAHCKRSFNGSRETSDSTLPRSGSDSCDEMACLDKCMEGCH